MICHNVLNLLFYHPSLILPADLPEVIREMRKEQAVYKSKKNKAKGGMRENQVSGLTGSTRGYVRG